MTTANDGGLLPTMIAGPEPPDDDELSDEDKIWSQLTLDQLALLDAQKFSLADVMAGKVPGLDPAALIAEFDRQAREVAGEAEEPEEPDAADR